MKILLDECVPLDFRHSLPDHDVHTAQWAGFKGLSNGKLLSAAEAAGYEVLLTVDQGIAQQQRLGGRKLAVIIVRTPTNQLEDLMKAVDDIRLALGTSRPGEVVIVS